MKRKLFDQNMSCPNPRPQIHALIKIKMLLLFVVACFQLLKGGHIVEGFVQKVSSPGSSIYLPKNALNHYNTDDKVQNYMSKDDQQNDRQAEFQNLFPTLEPKWFRRRYLDFKPGGVISSTSREGAINADEEDSFISPLNRVGSQGLIPTPNIRQLAIFPFIDGQAFPTGVFPMNIFVMKYRMMINDVYNNPEKLFGIVFSDSSDGFCTIGTSVEIQEREMQSDGRQILYTVCRSRFKILRIIQEEPYMICEVDYGIPDLDVFLAQDGVPPPPILPRDGFRGSLTGSSDVKIGNNSDYNSNVRSQRSTQEDDVPVQGELSPYLCRLEREVYQALCDVISLANKKNLGGEEASITKPVLDLAPDKHPFRLSVASDFSFAMSDMLGCDPKLKQLLLESPTLELRLRRLRALLVGTRDFLYEQLQEEEPFG